MSRKSVYLETSFISYLTSRPSRDLIAAASQAITRDWWDTRRDAFELYVSELVLEEAKDGHPEAAAKRLEVMADIELLNITDEVIAFARTLVTELVIPEKAAADAIHISVAAVNGINYLMTWNCKHIANAEIFEAIEAICEQHGYRVPIICTPQELLEMHR